MSKRRASFPQHHYRSSLTDPIATTAIDPTPPPPLRTDTTRTYTHIRDTLGKERDEKETGQETRSI